LGIGVFNGLNTASDAFNSPFVQIDVQFQDLRPIREPVLPIG
jgi:hypothetical protein